MSTLDTPTELPVGPLVSDTAALPPSKVTLNGKHCTLTPLTIEHAPDLYTNIGGLHNASLWPYLPTGPYDDLPSFTDRIKFLCQDQPFYSFAILSSSPAHASNAQRQKNPQSNNDMAAATPVGIITFLNIVPINRSIEIGHVIYAKTLQRTSAATEAVYLLMKHCFEDLHYLRVEWKANDLNEPSKRAALRLGFAFEGVFKKHMVVKSRRRDTAWFSITDDEWVGVSERTGNIRTALEGWLARENFDVEGRQRRKLEDFRKAA